MYFASQKCVCLERERERERERCAVTRQAPASPVMQGVRKIEEWIGQKGKKVELEPAEILYESSFSGNQ